jgi:hypothetical protein
MRGFAVNVPFFLPVLALGVALAMVTARPIARRLRTRPTIAFLLVASLALVLAATLTPHVGAFSGEVSRPGWCDMGRVGFIPPRLLLSVNEASLNVLLFVPLGLALGLLPGGTRRRMLVVAAFALPVVIEVSQSYLVFLGRGCESQDVFDNITGLVAGLALGMATARLVTLRT